MLTINMKNNNNNNNNNNNKEFYFSLWSVANKIKCQAQFCVSLTLKRAKNTI